MRVINLACTLKHPNIVNCLGIWSEVRLLYDDMLEGMEGIHARDEADLASIGKDILEGLRYLKDQNVVHGDLKPSNILIDHDRRTVKISDSKSLSTHINRAKTWWTTSGINVHCALRWILYASPESLCRALWKEDCETSDIWSFGI
ncbi:mitogen-activated protein kinase kinase 4-like [Rhododendron vialii]|uniref:mitogen-activated protein kinase kinase 4-like n=1 Tax=Rhododendron vialii TaxID=182163 RepID=UPI00265E7A60|nr:mitogen-activated protein kinase kinase 4-like [Rhododendron vialii]